jgi:hypothetical protein
MQPEHRIDELIVDLSFTTTRLARHEKALLSGWLTEDLLPALDQLFSHYSPGQQVLRFETLEFDFGNLTNRNYQHRIREQLLKKMAQLLQTQLLAVVPAHLRLPEHAGDGGNPNTRVALEQLFNYLASGQLSAHQPFEQPTRPADRELTSAVNRNNTADGIVKVSDITNNTDKKYAANIPFTDSQPVKKVSKPIVKQNALHEQLLDAVIAQHNIAELLRELPQRDALIQRLLTQFSVPQRLELLRQLAPQHLHNAVALLDLLQLVENNSISADTYRLDSNVVWQSLLQLGLEYPQANVEFWLRHIFRTVSAHAAIDSRLLQHYLTVIKLPFSSAATPLINLQSQIAQLSAGENVSTSEPYFAASNAGVFDGQAAAQQPNLEQFDSPQFNPAQPDTKKISSEKSNSEQLNAEQFNSEQLRQLIAAAFIRADASQLQQLWPQLMANEPQWLVAALAHYLPQAEIRQQLMLRLPLVLQAEIIALLAPAFKEQFFLLHQNVGQLIELLAAQSTLLLNVDGVATTSNALEPSAQSPELLLRQLWEIALGLIFNKQSAAAHTDYAADSNRLLTNLAVRYADLHNLDHNFVQQAFVLLFNQPQTHQQSLINTVNLPKRSGELHGNATVSHEHQTIKPEVDLLSDSAASVSAESGNISQKSIVLEKNDQTSKNLAVKNQEANSDQADNQGSDNYEDIDSGVNGLSRVSDHQLFDLCLRLKSGALAWQSLANNIPLLQRLISSYIRLGHSATAENCADFVAAIETQAETSSAPSAFYLVVLQSLIADKLIDLEAIALDVKSNTQSSSSASRETVDAREEIKTIENLSIIKDQTAQASAGYDVESNVTGTNIITDVITPLSLDVLAEELQQGKRKAESLKFTGDQFAQLVDIFIAKEKKIAPDIQADLIAAIHQQALHANNKTDYYRRVLEKLLRKETLDLVQVCEQVNQQDISLPTLTHPTLAQPIVAVATASNNIEAIARALLAESAPEQWLQTLQLDFVHWQNLVAELIQQTRYIDKDEGADLIEAVQRQAHQSINFAHYYRLVVGALVEHKPIDLEAFVRAANSARESIVDQLVVTSPNPSQPGNSALTVAADAISIAQTLLIEPQSWGHIQTLQFDNKQWEALTAELIQQSQFTDQHAGAELIAAIQTQARIAITPAVYYRRIIQAVLQQQPIDLEAFAENSAYQNIKQLEAGQVNTATVNAVQIHASQVDIPQIDAAPFSSGNISQNINSPNYVNPDHVNPDQAMDYPLLTGSDNSLRKPALSLAQLLAAELPLSQEQLLALQQHINTLLNRSNQALVAEWRELLASVQHAHVLIHSVPAHLLHQITMRLHADRYTWLDAVVKLVIEALALLVADINNLPIKQAKWKFIFKYLFATDSTNSSTAETSVRAQELSLALCEQLASAAGIDDVQRLVNLTQRRIALLKPPAQQKPAMRLQDITTNPATHSDATTPQWEAGLHINNAGQVLAAAFLPRLFSMLNLMQDGKFIHLGAADRAVHLVQFMVTGQSATPEYELVLNKILCGIGTSIPVSAGIEITEQEQTLIEQMLNSMIQHWKVLGSTSITGLRETFFQRQGWLVLEEDCWRLKVKEQTFDLLLDRLPWSISLIKHGWMEKPLRVSWRNHS